MIDAADAAKANGTRIIVVGYGDVDEDLLLALLIIETDLVLCHT